MNILHWNLATICKNQHVHSLRGISTPACAWRHFNIFECVSVAAMRKLARPRHCVWPAVMRNHWHGAKSGHSWHAHNPQEISATVRAWKQFKIIFKFPVVAKSKGCPSATNRVVCSEAKTMEYCYDLQKPARAQPSGIFNCGLCMAALQDV